jgi:hypothetical protein
MRQVVTIGTPPSAGGVEMIRLRLSVACAGGMVAAALFLFGAAAQRSQAAGDARADALSCGTVLASPGVYVLAADLNCSAAPAAPALLITSVGVTINLNGHSIIGPGLGTSTVGVQLEPGSDALIENGVIRRFGLGVSGIDASVDVENARIARNGAGIWGGISLGITVGNSYINENAGDGIHDVNGGGIHVFDSQIVGNGNGIWSHGTRIWAERNVISRNGYGIWIEEFGVDLEDNQVSNNGGDGIHMGLNSFPDDYTIVRNTAIGNGGHGIVFDPGFVGSIDHIVVSEGNIARKNRTDPQCVNIDCITK